MLDPFKKRVRSQPATHVSLSDSAACHSTLGIATEQLDTLMVAQPVCNLVSKPYIYRDVAIFCQQT